MAQSSMRELPYLQQMREQLRYSQTRLAKESGVDRHTISGLESEERQAQRRTIEALASALGVLPEDLTGRPGVPEEQHREYLRTLAGEPKAYGPGDPLYDADPIAALTDLELAEIVRKSPELRHRVSVVLRMRRAVEEAAENARELEDPTAERDAG